MPCNLDSADYSTIIKDLNSQIAVLGKIADDKFKRVKKLQLGVVISGVFFFIVASSIIWKG